jgi:hypothetical protein
MRSLCRIAYFSRSRIAGSRAQVEAELARILAAARETNATTGITGALAFHDDVFAQALEGPGVAVMALFQRIAQDCRHSNARVLLQETATVRLFAVQPMAFADLGAGESRHPLAQLTLVSTRAAQSGEAGAKIVSLLRSAVAGAPPHQQAPMPMVKPAQKTVSALIAASLHRARVLA